MTSLLTRTDLFVHTLRSFTTVEPTLPCDVKPLEATDVPRLHEVWPVNLEEMNLRLQRGDRCLAGFAESRMAHYSWVQFSGAHHLRDVGQTIEILPGHAWIYHCRTADWARGRQIYPFVLTQILDLCQSRGCTHVWIYTSPANGASQHGIRKAGFIFSKQLASINLLGWKVPVFTL